MFIIYLQIVRNKIICCELGRLQVWIDDASRIANKHTYSICVLKEIKTM